MDKRTSRLHQPVSTIYLRRVRGHGSRCHWGCRTGIEVSLPGLQTGIAGRTVYHWLWLIPHSKHLVPFLPELHTFTVNIGATIVQEDKVVVYEAISYVISAMPMDQAAQSLKTFATSILAAVFALANKPTAATKQELQEVGSAFTYCIPRLFTEVFPKTA